MMIRDYKHFIKLQHVHTKQMLFEYAKVRCEVKYKWLILMITWIKTKQHNLKWPYIPGHPYRILIIEGSRSGKKRALLNSINNQPDIDQIYLYSKDSYEAKYQFFINKRESTGLNQFDHHKAFIESSNDMQDVYDDYLDGSCQPVMLKVW